MRWTRLFGSYHCWENILPWEIFNEAGHISLQKIHYFLRWLSVIADTASRIILGGCPCTMKRANPPSLLCSCHRCWWHPTQFRLLGTYILVSTQDTSLTLLRLLSASHPVLPSWRPHMRQGIPCISLCPHQRHGTDLPYPSPNPAH